jgi:hypothetical protein
MCHALWHRLDLDFVSDESNTGRLSDYTGRCLSVHPERWAEPADLLVAKVSSAGDKVDASCESTDRPAGDDA